MPDILIRNGTVIDPGGFGSGRADVAVTEGRIAAIGPSLAASGGAVVIDATGLIVTPGLIDLHTHLYPFVSSLGVPADTACLPYGVTTAVDAGTSGALTFRGLLAYCIRPSLTRILAFLNLSSLGLLVDDGQELADLRYADVAALAAAIEQHPGICVGVKVRIGKVMLGEHRFEVLELALEAASRTGTRLMVHITNPGLPLTRVLAMLRPGDIVTHLLHGRGEVVTQSDEILQAVADAQHRGVCMDVGHGGGSFTYRVARGFLAAGLRPDTISTDLHTGCIDGPCFDLPTTMTKFLGLGLSLDEVVAATTINAARAIGRERDLGTLDVGRTADLALFELRAGERALADCEGALLSVHQQLRPITVFRAGVQVMPPKGGLTTGGKARPGADPT